MMSPGAFSCRQNALRGRGGIPYVKVGDARRLSSRDVKEGFWSYLGCSRRKAIKTPFLAVKYVFGCTGRNYSHFRHFRFPFYFISTEIYPQK